MLARFNEKTEKTEQDMDDEFEAIRKMVAQTSKRKGRVRLSFIPIFSQLFSENKSKIGGRIEERSRERIGFVYSDQPFCK